MSGLRFKSPYATSRARTFSPPALQASGLTGLPEAARAVNRGSPDWTEFFEAGLLAKYRDDLSVQRAWDAEAADRIWSVQAREEARDAHDQMVAAGKANQSRGWSSALGSVAKAALPLAGAALGLPVPGLIAGKGAGLFG